MKKILSTIAPFVFVGLLLSACKKEDIPTYNSPASVYFSATSPLGFNSSNDSTELGFGYSPTTVTDSIFKIPVSIVGKTSPTDRIYKVVVDPLSTAKAGVHYDLPAKPVIHAGSSFDSLAITFYRTPDLLTSPVTLILHLEPNENFNTGMKSDTLDALTSKVADYTTYKVSVVDGLQQPAIWNFGRYGVSSYFGTFSAKKLRLLNSVTGMPLNALNGYDYSSYWVYWATMMNRYLLDQSAAGNTILEDDGTPMKMGIRVTG
jgi:hypothetical protein